METLTPFTSLSKVAILWVYFDPGGISQVVVRMEVVECLASDFPSSSFKSYEGDLVLLMRNINVTPYTQGGIGQLGLN